MKKYQENSAQYYKCLEVRDRCIFHFLKKKASKLTPTPPREYTKTNTTQSVLVSSLHVPLLKHLSVSPPFSYPTSPPPFLALILTTSTHTFCIYTFQDFLKFCKKKPPFQDFVKTPFLENLSNGLCSIQD